VGVSFLNINKIMEEETLSPVLPPAVPPAVPPVLPPVMPPEINVAENPTWEKTKYYIELTKWFIVSVVIVVVSLIIDSGIKERAQGMNEIEQYGKYATNLIILNEDIGPRRLLAQYFAYVTASEKLRKGWMNYYLVIDSEYRKSHDSLVILIKNIDSLLKVDTSSKVKQQLADLRVSKFNLEKQLNSTLTLPNNVKNSQIIYIQISKESLRDKALSLQGSLLKSGYNIPGIEFVDVDLKINDIRYFRDSDYSLANQLKVELETLGIKSELKLLTQFQNKVKEGTIELWLTN